MIQPWEASKDEADMAGAIAKRVQRRYPQLDVIEAEMDILACHLNGCPLDLKRMVEWERDFDVVHDVMGLNRHLDRNTGTLTNCFSPRFAADDY